MTSLVKHLHGFIRDVRLTEVEWNAAVEFLTKVGDTDDQRARAGRGAVST